MFRKIFFITSILFTIYSPAVLALDFPLGTWTGWIKFEGQESKFAVKLDTLIYQPVDLNEFPKFQMLFRVGLGGLSTNEYFSQYYETVHYDFDHGSITLDTAENDLVMALKVEKITGFTVLRGNIFSRSAATSGTIILKYLTDEPDDDDGPDKVDPTIDPVPFANTLSGQYEGTCGGFDAVFQIETARGMGESPHALFPGLSGYTINARFGIDDRNICSVGNNSRPGVREWCTYKSFNSGDYNIANGTLVLGGWGGAPTCQLRDGRLSCNLRISQTNVGCVFEQVNKIKYSEFKPLPRKYFVQATAEQNKDLPPPFPPDSTTLVTALTGTYSGFLHHEINDNYQPMRLNVLASVSSENPHNPNMVYISGASILHFSDPKNTQPLIWSQRFDRKTFYVKNGFTLDDHGSDSFIQINSWKVGFITGVLYSRQFGRVGTIQLVKGAMPSIHDQAKFVPSPLGKFVGPMVNGNMNRFWWFQTTQETQATELGKNTFSFRGELGTTGGLLIRRSIIRGAYDFFAQAVAFSFFDGDVGPRVLTGRMLDAGMNLFFPGAPRFGIIIDENHNELKYQREP